MLIPLFFCWKILRSVRSNIFCSTWFAHLFGPFVVLAWASLSVKKHSNVCWCCRLMFKVACPFMMASLHKHVGSPRHTRGACSSTVWTVNRWGSRARWSSGRLKGSSWTMLSALEVEPSPSMLLEHSWKIWKEFWNSEASEVSAKRHFLQQQESGIYPIKDLSKVHFQLSVLF